MINLNFTLKLKQQLIDWKISFPTRGTFSSQCKNLYLLEEIYWRGRKFELPSSQSDLNSRQNERSYFQSRRLLRFAPEIIFLQTSSVDHFGRIEIVEYVQRVRRYRALLASMRNELAHRHHVMSCLSATVGGEVGYRPLDDGFRREHPVRRRLARSVKLKPRGTAIERAGVRVPPRPFARERFTVSQCRSFAARSGKSDRNRRSVKSAMIFIWSFGSAGVPSDSAR